MKGDPIETAFSIATIIVIVGNVSYFFLHYEIILFMELALIVIVFGTALWRCNK